MNKKTLNRRYANLVVAVGGGDFVVVVEEISFRSIRLLLWALDSRARVHTSQPLSGFGSSFFL